MIQCFLGPVGRGEVTLILRHRRGISQAASPAFRWMIDSLTTTMMSSSHSSIECPLAHKRKIQHDNVDEEDQNTCKSTKKRISENDERGNYSRTRTLPRRILCKSGETIALYETTPPRRTLRITRSSITTLHPFLGVITSGQGRRRM